MAGECRKLAKPMAVIRKKEKNGVGDGGEEGDEEALEIIEIVKFKVVFSIRPEPVSKSGDVEMEEG